MILVKQYLDPTVKTIITIEEKAKLIIIMRMKMKK